MTATSDAASDRERRLVDIRTSVSRLIPAPTTKIGAGPGKIKLRGPVREFPSPVLTTGPKCA